MKRLKEKTLSRTSYQGKIPLSFICCCCAILFYVTLSIILSSSFLLLHQEQQELSIMTSILPLVDGRGINDLMITSSTASLIASQEGFIEEPRKSLDQKTGIVTSSSTTTTATSSSTTTNNDDSKRACHVIIVNAPDFHYEVIESTVLRYPLPFHKFNCTTSKPIIFDFLLYDNWLGKDGDISAGVIKPKYLNESEFWSWNTYFESYLQHNIFDRIDGTKALMNRVLKYSDMDNKTADEVDARIDVSCEFNQVSMHEVIKDDRLFCVLHSKCDQCTKLHFERSCFISPMWPKEQCTFMALDLPKFEKSELMSTTTSGHHQIIPMEPRHKIDTGSDIEEGNPMYQPDSSISTMRICIFGRNRNHTILSNLFAQVPYQKYNATFHIGGRDIRELSQVYERSGIDMSKIHIFFEKRYREYYRNVAQCNIYLPATDPKDRPAHFPSGMKRLTGSIPQVIAYKLPSVMHVELEKIYHEYLVVAPVEVYNDTFESKVKALTRMMERVGSGGFFLEATKS
jgi:hypothetical protein